MSAMNKCGSDPKVKKTLVRNIEQKTKPTKHKRVVREVENDSTSSLQKPPRLQTESELNQPTLCSSELLANYLSEVKSSLPPPLTAKDLELCKGDLSTKMTKKLNFHFNDRIYKNLIELNAQFDDLKTKKEKRPSTAGSSKRDVEPNIEDFYEKEEDFDTAPCIPVIKPKFKPIWRAEDGELHRLVSSFENL